MAEITAQNTPPQFWRMLMKRLNPFMKWLLRSPLHGVVSHTYLLLTFTGRKSGLVYTTPVQYAQEQDTLYIITSEGYTWWKNLRGGAAVQVRLRGKDYSGHADTASDPATITTLLARIYPGLSVEQQAKFLPGKVAIIIRLK